MQPKKIIVVCKTHLDIGFTDLSSVVTEKYMTQFIPNAIRVGEELQRQTPPQDFCWTTGSWLIYEYVNRANKAQATRLEAAVQKGFISWHALPFTMHSEYMTKELFVHGLRLSKQLDSRYGKQTIGAKLTDVPGHTKAIVPLLADAGIEFLHIGINTACPNPVTPPMFRWQVAGKEVTVLYNSAYGDFSPIGDSGVYVYFAHTGDNLGVQSASEILSIINKLKKQHPQATVVMGDLNDVAYAAREVVDSLPVITNEIGDTWIHGVGTDPGKTSMYRALLRYLEKVDDQQAKQAAYNHLLLVAEHTWGCDEKTHLHDWFAYSKRQLAKARRRSNFQRMERSWQEQRQYIQAALDALPPALQSAARQETQQYKRALTDVRAMQDISGKTEATIQNWHVQWNAHGELVLLQKAGRTYADAGHRLCTVLYEQFSGANYKEFFNDYNISKVWWAREDYTKRGMGRVAKKHRQYAARLQSAYQAENRLVFRLAFDKEAQRLCGAPADLELLFTFNDKTVLVDFAWQNKPANRIAEALWLGFAPKDTSPRITKLGMQIDPQDVVEKGNRKLFGTDDGVYYTNSAIHSLDASLAAFAEPSLLTFNQEIPQTEKGVFFNLYNNVWGTNFPMWYEEDARFRFVLDIGLENE